MSRTRTRRARGWQSTTAGLALVLAAGVVGTIQGNDNPAPPTRAAVTTSPDQSTTPTPRPSPTWTGKLPAVRVAPARTKDDYDRDEFGPAWADVDRNGCDTRNDILARDLDDMRRAGRCVVVAGVLESDPYTGLRIEWTKADRGAIQIDHIVSLADAWRSGGHRWTAERRLRFANDPKNLMAVDGPTNQSKGDQTPETWNPFGAARSCAYVRTHLAIKAAYKLTATADELRWATATARDTCAGPKDGAR